MTAGRLLPVMLLGWMAGACGMDAGAAPPDAAVSPDAAGPSLEQRIDDAARRIQGDTCFAGPDPLVCDWADYLVTPDQLDMAVSTGEAILVVDELAAGVYPQLLRYRNRILGFYRVAGDELVAQNLTVHLPKQLGDVVTSFAGPEFIPAKLLAKIGVAAGAAYQKVPLLFFGHGGIVFSHLVELTPEQPLVLVDLTGLFDLPVALCAGVDDETLAAATAHFAAIAASLGQIMAAQNVRFVNASFGDSVPTLTEAWSRTCGVAAPATDVLRRVLSMYEPLYRVLFGSEGVIAAQAATNIGDPADYPFDRIDPRYQNRVRVGFISSRASGLDELGRGDVHKAEQFPADGDADVYLNWDCESFVGCADPAYELAGPFGLASGSLSVMSSSYVDPLAVARLVNLRYASHSGEAMSDALIETLQHELTPPLCGTGGARPCVYQDPILHRQLEVYRRGYLGAASSPSQETGWAGKRSPVRTAGSGR